MRTACIQLCSGTDIDDNIRSATLLVRQAHASGAQFIATPENTHFMGGGTELLFKSISAEGECRAVAHFSALAKELSIDLLIGSLAIKLEVTKLEDTRAANRSFLFGTNGEIIARYDKIHMFDVDINAVEVWRESANYCAGQTPVIADVAEMKLGLSICYDLRFGSLYKDYAKQGAHIMSVPAAFTAVTGEAHWETLLRARAIETSAYVIAPAQGGVHDNGRVTWGHSMIVDPWGVIIAQCEDDKPGYCIADLDLEQVQSVRAKIPAWKN